MGTVRFDAKYLNLDVLLGETLDFDFKGILIARDGKTRMEWISLRLCGQPVKPKILEFVLHTAALAYGAETVDEKG